MPLIGVLLGCALVSLVGWVPLSIPPRLLALVVPRQGTCRDIELGTPAMSLCTSHVAFLTLLSPVVFTLILFLFRRQVGAWLRKFVIPRVPEGWRYLSAPLIATAVFAISWSYIHSRTWNRLGIVPEIAFPVVIGLFVYVTTSYSRPLQAGLRPYFRRRDGIPRVARFVIALLLPTALAFAIARTVPNTDLSSQLIVVISLLLAYLIMVPVQRAADPAPTSEAAV